MATGLLFLAGCGDGADDDDDSHADEDVAADLPDIRPDAPEDSPTEELDASEDLFDEPTDVRDVRPDELDVPADVPDAPPDEFDVPDAPPDELDVPDAPPDVPDVPVDEGDAVEADPCVPTGPEACDGVDNDCDGLTDEGEVCECSGPGDCEDGNPCTIDACDATWRCRHEQALDGMACPGGSCCAGGCHDLRTDPVHCGACGATCLEAGQSCAAGVCRCAPAPGSSSGEPVPWPIDLVDAPGAPGVDTSMAADASGNVFVSYYEVLGGDLRFAIHQPTGFWSSVELPDYLTIDGSAVVVAPTGDAQLVFCDRTIGHLRVATPHADGTWSLDGTPVPVCRRQPAAAYDQAGGLHIAFEGSGLNYAYRSTAGAWTTASIDPTPSAGDSVALAVDADGGIHIAYRSILPWESRYAYSAHGDAWTWEAVESSAGATGHVAIALDETVRPRVVHLLTVGDRHAWKPLGSTGWTVENLESAADSRGASSIAVTSDGAVHAVYCESMEHRLRHAWLQPGGSWSQETLATPVSYWASWEMFSALWSDRDGGLHAVLPTADATDYTGHGKSLSYGYLPTGGSWSLEPLLAQVSRRTTDYGSSVPTSASGTMYGSWQVFVAVGGVLHRQAPGNPWRVETVDSDGNVGRYTSTVATLDGRVHVAYYDVTNADLRYAMRTADGVWTLEVVDSSGDMGRHASLAVDASGAPHIAYYDATNGDLRYARRIAAGAWDLSTVDAGPGLDVGRDAAIATGPDGGVHISYSNTTDGLLRYAWQDPTSGLWSIEALDCGLCADQARNPAIAVDAAGGVHLAWGPYGGTRHSYRPDPSTAWAETLLFSGTVTCDPGLPPSFWPLADRPAQRAIAIGLDGTIHMASVARDWVWHGSLAPGATSWRTNWEVVPWDAAWVALAPGPDFLEVVVSSCELATSSRPMGGATHLAHLRTCLP